MRTHGRLMRANAHAYTHAYAHAHAHTHGWRKPPHCSPWWPVRRRRCQVLHQPVLLSVGLLRHDLRSLRRWLPAHIRHLLVSGCLVPCLWVVAHGL
jgi:hypothetical protein